MSKNDERILKLKKQIEEKEILFSGRKIKFSPETNCILELDGVKYNINVVSDDELTLLIIKLNMYSMSADSLEMPHPVICGYIIDLWISDIKNKLAVSRAKKEEYELKLMKSKLDKMLSDDKKIELELDEIASSFKTD